MNVDDELDVFHRHLGEGLVAQDTRIGDQDVDAAPLVHGVVDHLFHAGIVGNRRTVRDGFTAKRFDFLYDFIGRCRAAARSVHRRAEIVHDDLCTAAGEFERVTAAKTAACTGDDSDFAVKTNVCHGVSPD